MKMFLVSFLFLIIGVNAQSFSSHKLFDKYCMDCHDSDMAEGKVDFENPPLNWLDPETGKFWEHVIAAIETDYMPPAKKKKLPSSAERKEMVSSVKSVLDKNITIGGTGLRSFDRQEFENTIRSIFGYRYTMPDYFPDQTSTKSIVTLAKDLQLSETLIQAYYDVAVDVANYVLPQPKVKKFIPVESYTKKPEPVRLTSSRGSIARSIKSEKGFGTKYTGDYEITVRAKPLYEERAYYPQPDFYVLQVYSLPEDVNLFSNIPPKSLKAEFKVAANNKWQTFTKVLRLEEGEALNYRWKNGPIYSIGDGSDIDQKIIFERFKQPGLWAAWQTVDKRGVAPLTLYSSVMEALDEKRQPDNLKKLPAKFYSNEHNFFGSFVEGELKTHGPSLDVDMVSVKGPLKVYKSKRELSQEWVTNRFLGERKGQSDQEYLKNILKPFLTKAFRRPASADELEKYKSMALQEITKSGNFNDGVHLVLRAVLSSPDFLFRYPQETELNNYELAHRLSYFLTRSAPDNKLLKNAQSSEFTKSENLKKEVLRILRSNKSRTFSKFFTAKWLSLDKLESLMPDPRLKNYSARTKWAYLEEARFFLQEILENDLPLETFIQPDFAFVNNKTAKQVYGLKGKFSDKMKKVNIDKFGIRGGIMTLPATLMATANGVETQPVIRGVWLLENIMGVNLPHPPSSVPALEPDTSKAETVKQQLEAHKSDPNCASCHKIIDPVGFALENFDAVGQWRSYYPRFEEIGNEEGIKKKYKTINGQKVESNGVMPDGTPIKDVAALKKYMVKNIDMFANCLSQKLLTVATGREMNFAEKKEIELIVDRALQEGKGFKSLLVELIDSNVFRTR